MQTRLIKREPVLSSTGPSPLAQTSAKRRSPFVSNRAHATDSSQHLLDIQDEGELSSPIHNYTIQGAAMTRAQTKEEGNHSLEQKMDELNEKIERLTAMVIAQHYNSSDTPEDAQ